MAVHIDRLNLLSDVAGAVLLLKAAQQMLRAWGPLVRDPGSRTDGLSILRLMRRLGGSLAQFLETSPADRTAAGGRNELLHCSIIAAEV